MVASRSASTSIGTSLRVTATSTWRWCGGQRVRDGVAHRADQLGRLRVLAGRGAAVGEARPALVLERDLAPLPRAPANLHPRLEQRELVGPRGEAALAAVGVELAHDRHQRVVRGLAARSSSSPARRRRGRRGGARSRSARRAGAVRAGARTASSLLRARRRRAPRPSRTDSASGRRVGARESRELSGMHGPRSSAPSTRPWLARLRSMSGLADRRAVRSSSRKKSPPPALTPT